VICEATTDTTLGGTVGNTESDNTFVVDGVDNVTVGAGFGCGQTASWTQSWDITSPDPYTITA
jgi:hypothetical protein